MLFLEKNITLSESQFGFRKGRSTDLAIQTLAEKYYDAIENDEYMVGIYLDLSRAINTISHEILFRKLNYYGIRGTALAWIIEYLTDIKQCVSYNNSDSDIVNINIGVPHGSILGPLLFLLWPEFEVRPVPISVQQPRH